MARIVGDSPAFIRVISVIRGQKLCGLKIVANMNASNRYSPTAQVAATAGPPALMLVIVLVIAPVEHEQEHEQEHDYEHE